MSHKIEIAPNLAMYIDGKRVIGTKPYGLFSTTEIIVSDEDFKRLADRCLEVIADTPQTEKNCDNCGTPRDKCVYCIEEDRMWTPQTDCAWK